MESQMRIRTIKKLTTSEQAYEALSRMIASSDFQPGDRLPSQDKLTLDPYFKDYLSLFAARP